jgi:hypothetical protein
MSDMGFMFGIGDFVRLRISQNQHSPKNAWHSLIKGQSMFHCEVRGQIVSRSYDEYQGGSHRTYTVRWVSHDGGFFSELQTHDEIELIASESFPSNVTESTSEI